MRLNRKDDRRTSCVSVKPGSVAIQARQSRDWEDQIMKLVSIAVLAALLLLNAVGCSNSNVRASAPPPAPVVEVAPVIQKDVPVEGEWVGTLEGYVNAQIQPQVSGYLIRQDYHEGAFVKKGQLLFEIDP